MIEYRTANQQDMDELIDFINMVFSMLRIPHDFTVVLPKVYAGEARRSEIHEIACEDGRLCGAVGLLPFDLEMAGCRLHCGYIGSVSVHPHMRGRGVMRELMQRQKDKAEDMGLDLLALGGQRQRYEYYGFSSCGSRMKYVISWANVRHALSGADAQGIAFRPLRPGSEDAETAFALYEKQPVTGARTKESIALSLRSYWNDAWAICAFDHMVGYMMAGSDGKTIYELVLEDEAMLPSVIKAWVETKNASPLSIVTTPYDVKRNACLAAIAEGGSIGTDEMFLCLRPERVIEALMRYKRMAMPLEDGVVKLGFGGFGTIRIAVSGGEVSVCRTEEAPDIALGSRQAHEFVFGHDRSAWLGEDIRMPRGWFPLHLHVMEADRF